MLRPERSTPQVQRPTVIWFGPPTRPDTLKLIRPSTWSLENGGLRRSTETNMEATVATAATIRGDQRAVAARGSLSVMSVATNTMMPTIRCGIHWFAGPSAKPNSHGETARKMEAM